MDLLLKTSPESDAELAAASDSSGSDSAQVSQEEQTSTLAAFKSAMQEWQCKLRRANVSLTLGNDSPPRDRDGDLDTQEEIK